MSRIEAQELAGWFDAHAAGLVLYARQWVGGGTGAGAEDVVQEVFVKLAGLSKRPENVKAWLFTSVRHAAIDALRSAKRRAAREAGRMREIGGEREFVPRTDAAMDAGEVQEALAALSLEEREVITLKVWGGATFQEMAAITGMPLTTVYSRYRSGLEALRARWELPCRKI